MSPVDNIKIRQNWIEEQTETYAQSSGDSKDDAFLSLAASLILSCEFDDIEPGDIVDGQQDKQIDFIHIEDDEDKSEAEITIIQAKNTNGFSSNTVIQIRNGLDWIFERSKADLAKINNESFKNKILELRSLSEYGASNLSVKVLYVTNGDTNDLSSEYKDEAKILIDKYSTLGFSDFQFLQIGAYELVDLLNEGDRIRRIIDLELPIVYDVNRASIMEFAQGDTKSFVCTVNGTELAKAAQAKPKDSIFDLNVRPFYGAKGKVNRDILNTCTGDDAGRFWFLNNGVTMVCDSFDFNRDPDDPILKIKNAQIVNGCQTTVTLRNAFEQGSLDHKVRVLLRLYATDNPKLVEKITLTTNNQNKVTDRDLRANDPVQRDIEQIMLNKYDYLYERKNKQYRGLKGLKKKNIVPSPKAAQAYLAIVRAKPASARGYIGSIWSTFYEEIFKDVSVADLLLSFNIIQYCRQQAKASKRDNNIDKSELSCRIYGVFHIARVMGHRLVQSKWGHKNTEQVEKALYELDSKLDQVYADAVKTIVELYKEDEESYQIPAMYFKHTISQRNLNAKLNKMQATGP